MSRMGSMSASIPAPGAAGPGGAMIEMTIDASGFSSAGYKQTE
jgi:hypothetical protein